MRNKNAVAFLKLQKENPALHILATMRGYYRVLLQDLRFPVFFCIISRYSAQSKWSDFFCVWPKFVTSLSSSALFPLFSVWKHGETRIVWAFSFPLYNGSFVFSEPNTKASSNVSLFYVTTEAVVTCWLLMKKYIYLASKPAYTFES